ncbi:MAG TPA: hypothetical protein VM052_03025, partial [Candidatus Limnocylindrales bacterium]|nr:hypothetical protein [Candidatus Limnocylindrales bacterium]
MRPFGSLVAKEDALAKLLAAAPLLPRTERVPLERAGGRVLAEEVRAPFDVPPFARATMDGYALRTADTGPRRVVGDLFAGTSTLPT